MERRCARADTVYARAQNLPVLIDRSMHRRAERLNLPVLIDRSVHRRAERLNLPVLIDRSMHARILQHCAVGMLLNAANASE